MLSYRILAQDVPTTRAIELHNGVAYIMGELGHGVLTDSANVSQMSAMLTLDSSLWGNGTVPANIGPDEYGRKHWQSGVQPNSGNRYRDERNDFSSLTIEFTTGPIRWLGHLENGGIASCRPPS